jgi:glycerate kinase
MTLNVLIAPSGFKEALEADRVAACIASGVGRADPLARIETLPVVDGGEGTARILAEQTAGQLVAARVSGPVGQPIHAHFALLGGEWAGTAVVEMAEAGGLRLVPPECRDPLYTTTRGVGQLIRAALDAGVERILVGCGDSGTNDAGAGAAQALGVRLLDRDGHDLGPGGGELLRLARIELADRDRRLERVRLEVACNWSVTLATVTRWFGPQKGADTDRIRVLEAALERFAEVVERDLGVDVRSMPGGGASGGLGAGLHALLGATLRPRYDVVFRHLDLDEKLAWADVVITAEGRLDAQTRLGKVPAEIARRAGLLGVPVIVLAGSIGDDAWQCLDAGIDAFGSILRVPCTLPEAIAQTPTLLEQAAEQVWRLVRVGLRVGRRSRAEFQHNRHAC